MGMPPANFETDAHTPVRGLGSERALAAIAVGVAVGYLAWRSTMLGSGSTLGLSVPLLVLESWGLLTLLVLVMATWRRHQPVPETRADLGAFPLVEVAVDASSGDPLQLERTLVGLSALRGTGRVHVLTDAADSDLVAVTERFGIAAPVAMRAAPASIAALASSPLVLWLEAGQITMPDLLEATVARFDDADLAVCQLAVGLLNAESLLHLRRGGDREALVRDTVGPSLAASGHGPWFGAGSILRRDALTGIDADLPDDPETCRGALLARGARIDFESRELVRAEAADTLSDYLLRRRARSSEIRNAFTGNNAGARRSPARGKLAPLVELLLALNGLRQLLGVALICAVIVSGTLPFSGSALRFVSVAGPVWLVVTAAKHRLSAGSMGVGDWVRDAWRTSAADTAALFGRGRGTNPTESRIATIGALWPVLVAIVALDLALLARGWTLVRPDALPRMGTGDRVLVLAAGLAALTPLVDVVLVSTRRRQRRRNPRLETSLPITVGSSPTRTIDLSPGGAGLLLDAAPVVGTTAEFELTLPALDGGTHLVSGAATTRSAGPDPSGRIRVGLEFVNLADDARVALIGYCGVGHAIEFVERRPPESTPDLLEVPTSRTTKPVRAFTALAVVVALAVVFAGPAASAADADEAAVERICVVTSAGEAIADAAVAETSATGSTPLGVADASGCLAVAPGEDTTGWQATVADRTGEIDIADAVGPVATITVEGRSVTVLDGTGAPVVVTLRTFADGWSEPIDAEGPLSLDADGPVEAVEIRLGDQTVVVDDPGDLVVVLAVLRSAEPDQIIEINLGNEWVAFTDGMQVLPGRIAVRLADDTVRKLEVPADHEITLPEGTLRRLDVAQPTAAPAEPTEPPAEPSVEPTATPATETDGGGG